MSKHLITADVILALEAWLGVGLFGGGVGIVFAVVFVILAIVNKDRSFFRVAAIYALLLVATVMMLSESAKLARRRATPVIAAVNRYHAEQGRYPATLTELVPAYLPSIPDAGFTRMSRDFHYDNSRPQLYFSGMFHGIFAYDFPTESWVAND